ncbi:peroxidase 4-like protein [Carex littledalei]|uniref:Peroxidase 4-like protein n=1 Tax=Carex littledalei TaxID=544730 RepID=A0A833QYA2_9POAL|nr:peroxidase 4-like protein [Carex littledalei]
MVHFALIAILLYLGTSSNAQLSTTYYSNTCPNLSSTVQSVLQSAISQDARVGATLIRLFYHDCFVNGCDGSILLDDTSTFTGEKTAGSNKDSLTTKVFQVVDDIKTAVENACSGIVSCADIVSLAAMDSVSILGGPSWDVKLGRRDSTTASFSGANSNIPGPSSSLQNLISSFSNQGLSADEMVALSGT